MLLFDQISGRLFRTQREWEEAVRTADPLLRKAWLHFDQISYDEKAELALRLLSHMAEYLPESDIRELIEESDPDGDETRRAANEMLEGKLAGRELGALRQKKLSMRPVNPASLRLVTPQDVLDAMKRIARRAGHRKTAKKRSRSAPTKKRPGQAPRKPAKGKRRKKR